LTLGKGRLGADTKAKGVLGLRLSGTKAERATKNGVRIQLPEQGGRKKRKDIWGGKGDYKRRREGKREDKVELRRELLGSRHRERSISAVTDRFRSLRPYSKTVQLRQGKGDQ